MGRSEVAGLLDPGLLGMSRVITPSSMGRHFQGLVTHERDFVPENETEREVISNLEENGVQVGLYVFEVAVVTSQSDALNYRALKGPGLITRGTSRPGWYPGLPQVGVPVADALPDWNAVYPLARRAMQSFKDGGAGFETTLEGWNIAARPSLPLRTKRLRPLSPSAGCSMRFVAVRR